MVRVPCEADRATILRFLHTLPGPWAGWTLGGTGPAVPTLTRFLDPNWRDRGSLVAVWERGGPRGVVALASYLRLFDSNTAEVAVIVSRPPPHPELGPQIITELVARGATAGLRRFTVTAGGLDAETVRDLYGAGFGGDQAAASELVMWSPPAA